MARTRAHRDDEWTSMDDSLPPATKKRIGLLESAMFKLFTRPARVLDIEELGGAFRLVSLGGEALRGVAWHPGDKIQLQLGGWVQRTYTPIAWDAQAGRTRILVYLHGEGPAAQWARTLRTGDDCVLFGPRKSLDLAPPGGPVILFGDETSLGLAAALSAQARAVQIVLEVSRLADAMPAIDRLGIGHARVLARLDKDWHFASVTRELAALQRARPDAQIVLTGKGGSIQHVSQFLRRENIGQGRRQNKAYWAPGKAGMD